MQERPGEAWTEREIKTRQTPRGDQSGREGKEGASGITGGNRGRAVPAGGTAGGAGRGCRAWNGSPRRCSAALSRSS